MPVFRSSLLTNTALGGILSSGLRHEQLLLIAFETRDPHDPTSPRREASLFDSPRKHCVSGASFFVRLADLWGVCGAKAFRCLGACEVRCSIVSGALLPESDAPPHGTVRLLRSPPPPGPT